MADEFNTSGTNWWDSSRSSASTTTTATNTNNRFDTAGSSSSSSGLNNSFGWGGGSDQMVDIKQVSVSGTDHHLHMMGLGLSSAHQPPPLDHWNQALLRGGDHKSDQGSFRSMLQDSQLSSNASGYQESGMGFKMFSLDQSQFSPHGGSSSCDSTVTNCQGLPSNLIHIPDSSTALYGSSPSNILQGILGSDHHQSSNQPHHQSPINYQYAAAAPPSNYGLNTSSNDQMLASWSKVPQFLRSSPPKQQQQQQQHIHGQLHFSNNAPFWNPSAAAAASMADVRPPGFFPSLQPQFPTANFDDKPKNISEVRDSSSVVKKSTASEPASKRPRNENPSPLPAFKVRKEKMGDRITALQQLVSPFGKTDTASVLSEAIEYIKFLHEQVSVLSTPYMKSGAGAIQHQQNMAEKSKQDPEGGPKQDLRSRGLCLVPVSSTFPVTHESTVDFWTPTFGGTFR